MKQKKKKSQNFPNVDYQTDPKVLLETMIRYKCDAMTNTKQPIQPIQPLQEKPQKPEKQKSEIIRKRRRSQTESSSSIISHHKFKKSKSEKNLLACSAYRAEVEIEDKHSCHIQNIRNMTYEQWCHVKALPTPEQSPYHIRHAYDVNKLKEIWVGVSEKFVWITFCFFPVEEEKFPPSDEFCNMDPYYRKMDSFDYLCVVVESEVTRKKSKASKHEKFFTFCTEFDMINRLRASNDYPFPIQMFPILEHARTTEEQLQRRDRARKFFLLTCERVGKCSVGSKKSGFKSMVSLSKEVGVDMEMPSWASSLFNSPGSNCFKALWNTGIIRTAIDSMDAAIVSFTINGMLDAQGVLELPYYELPRVLHENLRDNQRQL